MVPLSVQVPAPLHVSWLTCTPAAHDVPPLQVVAELESPQTPAPLQVPVLQVFVGHSLSGSRLLPMLPQTPSAPEPFLVGLEA